MVGQPEFAGKYEHSLDDKGRIIIPTEYRLSLGEKFYLCSAFNEKCIWALPLTVWNDLYHGFLKSIDPFDMKGQQFLRTFSASVVPSELDKQGRIFLPQDLRDYAEVKGGKVVITGVMGVPSRIEIWDAGKWQALQSGTDLIAMAKLVYQERKAHGTDAG